MLQKGQLDKGSEKAMAPHSSTFAWKIPWTEEPGRLQSMGLLRVGHDWATSLSLFTFTHWRRKWQPTPVFCLENPRDEGAWWAAIYGVAQSRTRLMRRSSRIRVEKYLQHLVVRRWWHQLGLFCRVGAKARCQWVWSE